VSVPRIDPEMLARIVPGHALPTRKEPPVEALLPPLASAAFQFAGVIGLLALVQTIRERRRG
jgi:hypothetical protein